MAFTPSTQPESNWFVIKRSWQLYSASFYKVFILAMSLSVIAFLPRLFNLVRGVDYLVSLPANSPHRLWLLVIDLACLVFFTCMMWRIRCYLLNRTERLEEDFRVAIHKLPLIIVAALIQTCLFLILLVSLSGYFSYLAAQGILLKANLSSVLMVVIPGFLQIFLNIFLFFLLIFYLPLIVTENSTILGSLKRSAQLVWGNWWRVFFVQSFPWACYVLTLLVIRGAFHLPIHLYLYQVTQLTISGLYTHILIFALFIPWCAASLITQLHDLELRELAEKNV